MALLPDHRQISQVIQSRTLWGETTCRVWLPSRESVVRLPGARLAPLVDAGTGTADPIAYVGSAARVADALTQDVLLAPIESSVIPLPHQIRALSRAISGDRVRDLTGRGEHEDLGLPQPAGSTPLVDALHRLMHLWAGGNLDALNQYAAERGLRGIDDLSAGSFDLLAVSLWWPE